MAVTVTLVVGSDGSTSKNGNSAGVSTSADRTEFLSRRRTAPVTVVVISRSLINPLADNRLAHCWNLSPVKALERAIETFGPTIHVEAGISVVNELIAANRVDFLELSITDITGGDDVINIDTLLSHFPHSDEKVVDGTRFISARR